MSIKNISIKNLIIAIMLLLGVFSIALSWYTSHQLKQSAVDSQSSSLSRIVSISARAALADLETNISNMGQVVTQDKTLRAVANSFRKDPVAKGSVAQALDSFYHQSFVTSGLVKVFSIRYYSADLRFVTASNEGVRFAETSMPDVLADIAKGRKGAARLQAIGGSWMSSIGPVYSYLVPIGGLRLTGYVEIMADPSHNLLAVEEALNAPLKITDANGINLYTSDHWSDGNGTFVVSSDFQSTDGQPLFSIQLQEDARSLFEAFNSVQIVGFVSMAILLVLLIGLALWFMGRYLFAPMDHLMESMQHCADGDLHSPIAIEGLKETVQIANQLELLVKSVKQEVSVIRENADQLLTEAGKLSMVTVETREGANQQQQESQMIATAMNELSATAQEVANNTESASSLAQEADDAARMGSQVVSRAVRTITSLADEVGNAREVIHRLENDAETIGSVLDVIKGIAEQTNLLALNAAIEAARAGEQGRGFAVVADEVRTLAGKTQQSTQEIQAMIEQLQSGANKAVVVMDEQQKQAEVSVGEAREVESALGSIAASVANIKGMNVQIATAAEEQTAVVEEINRNVVSIAEIANKTADGAARTSDAGMSVEKMSEQLQTAVSHFKL